MRGSALSCLESAAAILLTAHKADAIVHAKQATDAHPAHGAIGHDAGVFATLRTAATTASNRKLVDHLSEAYGVDVVTNLLNSVVNVIGKLNFLEKSTRLDLSYAVQQCARFAVDPKASHAAAVKRIARYLVGTKDKGIALDPHSHLFDCWVDASFVGDWN